jgi:CBS domain-containing protein
MSGVADFLQAHAPFDALDRAELERVAAVAEAEQHAAGATIFAQGSEPVRHLRVVRSGAVELILDGRVIDLLEPGELLGHPSMLSGLPTGFAARAAQDTVCLRIPDDVAQELLARPAGLRYVARSLLDWPRAGERGTPHGALDAGRRPVGTLIRGAPVVCAPDTPIRQAAQLLGEAGQTAVVIDLGDGSHGIVTDRDLRMRVVATGIGGDAPVSAVMTAPAYTTAADRLASDVLLDMLDRGLRHYPVVSATGEIVGVVDDIDLVAVETRSSFHLRQAIARAATAEDVAAAAQELPQLVVALHDARVAAADVSAIHTVVVDALTRRLLELAVAARTEPLPSFSWLALGSQGRREFAPSSDIDSAIIWFDAGEDVHDALHAIGSDVSTALEACGLRPDEHRATAADPLCVRSRESWQRAARSWLDDPTQEQAGILVSVFGDSRPVWGVHMGSPLADSFRGAAENAALLALLARMALARRPPTGFLRGLVVEDSGEHRGTLDVKSGGIMPIVNLARWAGLAAGVTSASTRERLKAAGEAGTLPAADARLLTEALDLLTELRLSHQVEQLRAGATPNDPIDPESLSALTRAQLKEAFRAVASVQKRVS